MKAQILRGWGGPEKFELAELPVPTLRPGCVLIKVAATSLNPIDIKIRNGLPIGPELPAVLGADVSGTVVEVAPDVDAFAPGDAVFGCAGGVRGQGGALAQFMVADARLLARAPRSIPLADAAALPLVSITAWDALERIGLAEGDRVLVQGALGGVGHVAVQLARTRGAKVAATVSGDADIPLALSLGAEVAANGRTEAAQAFADRTTGGRGFDAVIDTIGGDQITSALQSASVQGQVVTTNARHVQDLSLLHSKALSLHAVFMLLPMLTGEGRERHGRALGEIARLVDQGKLKPLLNGRRFSLETAPDAHRCYEAKDFKGKILIEVDG